MPKLGRYIIEGLLHLQGAAETFVADSNLSSTINSAQYVTRTHTGPRWGMRIDRSSFHRSTISGWRYTPPWLKPWMELPPTWPTPVRLQWTAGSTLGVFKVNIWINSKLEIQSVLRTCIKRRHIPLRLCYKRVMTVSRYRWRIIIFAYIEFLEDEK